MTGWSCGNSFGNSGTASITAGGAVGVGPLRWPVPGWRFGLRQSDDRGTI